MLADAAFIIRVRLGDARRNRFIHPISPDPKQQEAWLAKYFEQPGDFYFVIESRGSAQPEGLIGLYDVGKEAPGWAEWGRWVLLPESLAAIESALLIYRVAFELLGLVTVYCQTIAENGPVVSFHDRCGLARERDLPGLFELNGTRHDAVRHLVTQQNWPLVRTKLEKLAALTARKAHS
jgi:RimJ/RimL family protein N-acetyltransferase